jgi:hypothetical protein
MVALVACGSASPPPTPPARPRDAAAPPARPTAAECSSLLDHAIELTASSHNATQSDRAKLRGELEPEFLPKCQALAMASYRCAIAAATTEALAACDSAQP